MGIDDPRVLDAMRYGWERWGTLGGDYDVWDDTEDDCDYDDDEELEFGEDEQ